MRLDHLLSREPSLWGTMRHDCLGCAWLFSCACMCLLPDSGWWVWVRFWVGHKKLYERAHCRVHVQHRVSVRCPLWWWLPTQPASECCLLVWVVCGGLFVICIVVASIFVLYCFCVLFSFVGHSVDALASRADEGRCGLRYASGSWRASVIIRGCPNGGT